ncbi:MAG: M23 family metallopeptidase, partial [Ornithinimicrobium sp.]
VGCLMVTGGGVRAAAPPTGAPAADPEDIGRLLSTTAETVGGLVESLDDLNSQTSRSRGASSWSWPLAGPQVPLRPFDGPSKRWLPGHRGVDLAGWQGSPVRSVAAGVVSYSGEINSVGIVSVLHLDGILSTYQPVADPVSRGSSVHAGQRVGSLSDHGSHCWPVTCLHLGARIGRDYIDPMLLLHPWEVSLLPRVGR